MEQFFIFLESVVDVHFLKIILLMNVLNSSFTRPHTNPKKVTPTDPHNTVIKLRKWLIGDTAM